eukprot:761242-Hanusia_phi.AAC.3
MVFVRAMALSPPALDLADDFTPACKKEETDEEEKEKAWMPCPRASARDKYSADLNFSMAPSLICAAPQLHRDRRSGIRLPSELVGNVLQVHTRHTLRQVSNYDPANTAAS